MGEAKRRGPREERVSKATAAQGVRSGYAAALGFVIERSEQVETFVRLATMGIPFAQDARFKAAFKFWLDADPGYRFFVYVRRVDGRELDWHLAGEPELCAMLPKLVADYQARHQYCKLLPIGSEDVAPMLAELIAQINPESQVSRDPEANNWPPTGIQIINAKSPSDDPMVVVQLDRSLIERGEISGFLRVLDSLVANQDTVDHNAARMHISFDGYNADPREIFEVPEVQSFLRRVAEHAPWWIVLASPITYLPWFGSLVKVKKLTRRTNGTLGVEFDPDALRLTVEYHVQEVAPLLRCAGFEEGHTLDTLLGDMSMSLGQFLSGHNASQSHALLSKPGGVDKGSVGI